VDDDQASSSCYWKGEEKCFLLSFFFFSYGSKQKPPMTARELSTASILLGIGGSVQQIGNDKWAPWQLLGKREEKKRKPKKKTHPSFEGQPCDPASTCLAARKKIDAELKV
jgi:hypothetical protein